MNDHEAALPHNNGAKTGRIDLGLAILSALAPRGKCYTDVEIAAFCECSPALISAIEARARRRLREKLREKFGLDGLGVEEGKEFGALQIQP